MTVKIHADGHMTGQKKAFLAYEKSVTSGKIPTPFTVTFYNTQYGTPVRAACNSQCVLPCYGVHCHYPVVVPGKVNHRRPVPLTPNGNPKICVIVAAKPIVS